MKTFCFEAIKIFGRVTVFNKQRFKFFSKIAIQRSNHRRSCECYVFCGGQVFLAT